MTSRSPSVALASAIRASISSSEQTEVSLRERLPLAELAFSTSVRSLYVHRFALSQLDRIELVKLFLNL